MLSYSRLQPSNLRVNLGPADGSAAVVDSRALSLTWDLDCIDDSGCIGEQQAAFRLQRLEPPALDAFTGEEACA